MRVYPFYYLKWRHLVNRLPLRSATSNLQHHGVDSGVSRLAHRQDELCVCGIGGQRQQSLLAMRRFFAKASICARCSHSWDGLPLQKFQVCARTNKKAALLQRWARNAPYIFYGCPENIRDSLTTPTATFYQRVSTASYANRWYSQRRNVRLSVRLSVRPSHSGIVSKRRKLASRFLHHPRAKTF